MFLNTSRPYPSTEFLQRKGVSSLDQNKSQQDQDTDQNREEQEESEEKSVPFDIDREGSEGNKEQSSDEEEQS